MTGSAAANSASVDIGPAIGCTPVAAPSSIRCDCGDAASLVRTGMLGRWSRRFLGDSTCNNAIPCRQIIEQRPVQVGFVGESSETERMAASLRPPADTMPDVARDGAGRTPLVAAERDGVVGSADLDRTMAAG